MKVCKVIGVLFLFFSTISASFAAQVDPTEQDRKDKLVNLKSCFMPIDCARYLSEKIEKEWVDLNINDRLLKTKMDISLSKSGELLNLSIITSS